MSEQENVLFWMWAGWVVVMLFVWAVLSWLLSARKEYWQEVDRLVIQCQRARTRREIQQCWDALATLARRGQMGPELHRIAGYLKGKFEMVNQER